MIGVYSIWEVYSSRNAIEQTARAELTDSDRISTYNNYDVTQLVACGFPKLSIV